MLAQDELPQSSERIDQIWRMKYHFKMGKLLLFLMHFRLYDNLKFVEGENLVQIIVVPESLDGHPENGSLVQFQGNWYRVVSTEYRDERGPGVLLYRTAAEGSRINPDRQVLVVKEDITRDECYLGEIISYTEQLWIVDDLAYRTPF